MGTPHTFADVSNIASASSEKSQSRCIANVRGRNLFFRHFGSYRTCGANASSNFRFTPECTGDITIGTAFALLDSPILNREDRQFWLVDSCTRNWWWFVKVSEVVKPSRNIRAASYDSTNKQTWWSITRLRDEMDDQMIDKSDDSLPSWEIRGTFN